MFKKRRGIKLDYNRQGLVYFLCMNYNAIPAETQLLIKSICDEVAPNHSGALFAMLTDDTKNVHSIAMNYYISESQLYLYRKKFYERFAENL